MQESDKLPETDHSDTRSTAELIAAVCARVEYDDDYWQFVKFIGYRLPEIFPKIAKMTVNESETVRNLATTALGHLRDRCAVEAILYFKNFVNHHQHE